MPAPWFAFNPSEHLENGVDLTPEQHGILLLLLCHAWERGGALPADERRLILLVSASCDTTTGARLKRTIRSVLDTCFYCDDEGNFRNEMIDDRIRTVQSKSKKQSENAQKRWGKHNRNNVPLDATASEPDVPIDRDEEEDNDHPSGDSPPSTSKSAKAKAKKSNSEHGTRLPDDWKPDQDGIDFAVKRLGSLEDTREVFGDFRRHWLSKPDPGAHKVRWDLVWESWVEEAVRRRGKGAKGRKVTGMQALREYCGERDYRPGGKISAQQGIREYFGEVYESGSERGNIIEGELVDKQKDNLFKFGS